MNSPQLAQTGVLDMIMAAGPVGKTVLVALVLASLYSWMIIFAKRKSLKAAAHENAQFLNTFWNSKSIEEIFTKSDSWTRSPIAQVFRAGVKELKKFSPGEFSEAEQLGIENVSRALARQANQEIAGLEKGVSWLATLASASPFIGLFGTVWGIMDSFHKIGLTGSANLAVVAPGISEALIATAVGIFVAIPAVMAYNHFSGAIRRQATDIDGFNQDFLNIIQRNLVGTRMKATHGGIHPQPQMPG
jgi:biopolymer transport protein TolQ